MADVRIDDCVGEVDIRSTDDQETKTIELFAHAFRVQDGTGKVEFLDDATRERVMQEIEEAILVVAHHGVTPEVGAEEGSGA